MMIIHRARVAIVLMCTAVYAPGCATIPSDDSSETVVSIERALSSFQLTTDHTPWEILHGIIAHGITLQIYDPYTEDFVSAVDFICTAETVETERGTRSSIELVNGFPQFITTYGEGLVQGHPWQFLAKLTAAGVALDQPVKVADGSYTLIDVLSGQLQALTSVSDIALVEDYSLHARDEEVGWMLEALLHTLPAGGTLVTTNGAMLNAETVVTSALERPDGWGACGGTHRLMAMAKWHRQAAKESSLWDDVGQRLDEVYELALSHQHANGSYDHYWAPHSHQGLHLDEWPDTITKIYMTGHMLAWMATWLDEKRLGERPVQGAYEYLRNARVDVSTVQPYYDALSHAYEAMALYEQSAAMSGP